MYIYKFNQYRPERRVGRRQLLLAAAVTSLMMFVFFSMIYLKRSEEALASRIAPQILRFHVLANSDGEADQQLKLEVKQLLIDTMYEQLTDERLADERPTDERLTDEQPTNERPTDGQPAEASMSNRTSNTPFSRETVIRYILTHREELEERAEAYMAGRGYHYPAAIRLERCYFPTKVYGDVTFPCGTYDAVRVLLGSGEGKNWWCVLYPALCFTDNAYGQVPDSSKRELSNLLDGSDYTALMKNRRVVFGDSRPDTEYARFDGARSDSAQTDSAQSVKPQITVRVRFRLPELLRGLSD